MQRYHPASCTSAVNNNATSGASSRDNSRADSSSLPANFALNSRRASHLSSYKLKCDKEPLNSRLGPPDFLPQTPNCPEETLTKEYLQSGYRETVEGLEEAREISLTQVQAFNKPVILKCREAIRKCHRVINESRAQKRKAGQVYGVPLSNYLLTKPGVFPELRPSGEEFRKKWIEGLSQQHKRLRSLADYVPQGYRKNTLFEVLIKNNVPLLRATWFIKVTYLNQVRPSSATILSGLPDKAQFLRTELWTKDVIDYLQYLLNEFLSRNSFHSAPHSRDRSPQMMYAGSLQQRCDLASTILDDEEPSLHFKWWYVVRLVQWHHAEGLIFPSLIIDWVLSQLQEKEMLEILQLLLPIIYGVLETAVLSQTYVRSLVGIAFRFIREPSPGGSDLVDNSRRAYTTSALIEMLQYLILAVPDTFVALDCFPLPPCLVSHPVNDGSFVSKASDEVGKIKNGSAEAACLFRGKGLDAQFQSLSFDQVVSTIQRRADSLAKAASPGHPGHGVAKSVQALDEALMQGDIRGAYKFLFEEFCDGAGDEGWLKEVSPCLRSSLNWIGTRSLSFVSSVFFLCEWATCNFRDFRTASPYKLKFTGRKEFSQVYIAIRLLKLKIENLQNLPGCKNENSLAKGFSQHHNYSGRTSKGNVSEYRNTTKAVDRRSANSSNLFASPGPLHDIIVCWIDQHEAHKGEGFNRLQLLIVELIRSGIFYPQAYVRQLIVSGIMDTCGSTVDLERRKRHYRLLKQLHGTFIRDVLEEAKIVEGQKLLEAMQVYSNERRLVLRGLLSYQHKNSTSGRDGVIPALVDQKTTIQTSSIPFSARSVKNGAEIEDVKAAISVLLQLPKFSSTPTETGSEESQGSVKRLGGSINKTDTTEGTPGCEECRRVKRQKISEERSSHLQGQSPVPSDDEDTWWMRKSLKSLESLRVDPPLKSIKQVSRGRQKIVRKTQSLAQLAAARIEGSQGASTSHVCDNKVSCPHHRTGMEGEKSVDGIRASHCGDVVSIGKHLKQLRFVEKRDVAVWLINIVRQLVEETEKVVAKVDQLNKILTPVDDKGYLRWKLGEDELAAILYLMDQSNDLVSAVKFVLWLLPKILVYPSSSIHSGRSILILQRNVENHACEVGEAFLLSSLRRYENILIATDLVPEALSSTMRRASAIIASNGRISGSGILIYARYLLKKYGSVISVVEWEKKFKENCDKRLLSELESARLLDGELVFPLGVPAGVGDPDDFLRQKISGGRFSRAGLNMKDIVQRHVDDAFHYFSGKDRKLLAAGTPKSSSIEKWDGYQIAQQITMGLMDCIRQTGGAAQEGDPCLVSSAVCALVSSVGPTIAKMPDFTAGSNHSKLPSTASSLNIARSILRIHVTSLSLLKEALGERQSRVFDIAFAAEASSALAGAFAHGKASRSQFQSSSDASDSNTNMSNETLHNSAKVLGKHTKIAAAISALVIGAIVQGVTSLERMVTVFRLKEGLDVIQFVRNARSNSNGNARLTGTLKVDNSVEVHVHWFRLLVGNCRTVSDGLIVELLGEPSIEALSRMQRLLPLSAVFLPAYSIFAFILWRPFILNTNLSAREDIHQLYHSFTMAIGDAIKHLPFRDVCLRNSQSFYDLVTADADATDAEFAAMLELNGSDMHLKPMAFVPLRARLFLNAIIDCKMPPIFAQDDGARVSGHVESKVRYAENEMKLLDKLVHVLDTLQPAKFHWQWIELRLLLNEQALVEKLEARDLSLAEAIRCSLPSPEKAAASENENNFIRIILTRLLVRPDAAPLFSEVVHLFGRSLEDSVLLQAKWFLGGLDVLFGRKSIRQRLINIAESEGLSTKVQFSKPWGWSSSGFEPVTIRGDKKFEVTSLEEGEVVEEGMDSKRIGKGSTRMSGTEGFKLSQEHAIEKAFIELLFPCIDQSSDDSRNLFASDLIKQLNNIEQQMSAVTHGASKQACTAPGLEGPANKGTNRKGLKGGSPGLARRQTGATTDPAPPSPAALRASMSLRLQLLLRLLPTICADRESSGRNLRHMLASVILRILGNRVVHEEADMCFYPSQTSSKREVELPTEASSTASADLSGESLFDRLLLVLHALLSSYQPSWLRLKHSSNSESTKFPGFDREVSETLQNELDHMHLPDKIRWRIQASMPVLVQSPRFSISCQPPSLPVTALASLQPSIKVSAFNSGDSNPPQRNTVPSTRTGSNLQGKSKPSQQDYDLEVDPWTLLEDGAGSGPSSSNTAVIGSGEHANLRASSWLKGTVRVRRTDLTYVGAVDDDS